MCVCGGGGTSITSLYRYAPPFSMLFNAPVDLALRTMSPVDPEYYGTRPPWKLFSKSYPQWWAYRPENSPVHSTQQHAGPHVRHAGAWLGFNPWPCRLVSPIAPHSSSCSQLPLGPNFFRGPSTPTNCMVKSPPSPIPTPGYQQGLQTTVPCLHYTCTRANHSSNLPG